MSNIKAIYRVTHNPASVTKLIPRSVKDYITMNVERRSTSSSGKIVDERRVLQELTNECTHAYWKVLSEPHKDKPVVLNA